METDDMQCRVVIDQIKWSGLVASSFTPCHHAISPVPPCHLTGLWTGFKVWANPCYQCVLPIVSSFFSTRFETTLSICFWSPTPSTGAAWSYSFKPKHKLRLYLFKSLFQANVSDPVYAIFTVYNIVSLSFKYLRLYHKKSEGMNINLKR